MRDMLDASERYPLAAWSAQFDRIRPISTPRCASRRTWPSPGGRPSRREYLASSVAQFWDAADRIFAARARSGREDEARLQIRVSLQARQAALSTTVARLLVQNNASEEQTAQQVQDIYDRGAAAGRTGSSPPRSAPSRRPACF